MNLVRYVHTGADQAAAPDFFVFCLFDGKNQSPAQHFHISIKELEKGIGLTDLCSFADLCSFGLQSFFVLPPPPPSVGAIAVFVKPVKVSRGDRVVLTTDVLLATDGSVRPEELLYAVAAPPTHGHLEYVAHPGVAISTFSQLDVAASHVAYSHDNRGGSPRDHFE